MTGDAGKPTASANTTSSFRTKPVKQRSIWESFAVLPPRTRLQISLAITAFAAAGIVASDYLEKAIPAPHKDENNSAEKQ